MSDVDEPIRKSPSANVLLVENRASDLFDAFNGGNYLLEPRDVLKIEWAIRNLNRVLEIDGERKNAG